MREAGGAEAHCSKCLTIRTSRLLPECADGTCAVEKDARDIQIVPMHRRGLPWWDIEKIDRESVRSEEFPALGHLCIRYRLLGMGSANAQKASQKKPCDYTWAQSPPRRWDWYSAA